MGGRELRQGHVGDRAHVVRAAPVARDHQHHRGSEVGRHPGVEGQFAGRGHIGEVAAQHDERVEVAGQFVEAPHDLGVRGRGIAVHVVIGDADGGLATLVDGRMREQQIHHKIRVR